MGRTVRFLIFLAVVVGSAACKQESAPPPPAAKAQVSVAAPEVARRVPAPAAVSVAGVALGKASDPDGRFQAPVEAFEKNDTIIAIVNTVGTGEATIKAKWTYQRDGQVMQIGESEQTIKAVGPASTVFQISKPNGWPQGNYQLEILLGDTSVGAKEFTVN